MPRLNQLPFPALKALVTILAQPCSPWKEENIIIYSACKSEKWKKKIISAKTKSIRTCEFGSQSWSSTGCREKPTQNSPQEFLTIQCSIPSSPTPHPATDTMWFGSERGWNSEKTPPEYCSRPSVAINAQLKDKNWSLLCCHFLSLLKCNAAS